MPEDIQEAYWAPEGQVLAMATERQAFLASGPGFEVQAVVTFTQPQWAHLGAIDHALAWSPSGNYVAVQDRSRLWVIQAAGGEVVAEAVLTTTEHSPWNVAMIWYPDEQHLVYNDRQGLWRLDIPRDKSKLLLAPEGEVVEDISLSKQYLAVNTSGFRDEARDIYVLDSQDRLVCQWPIQNSWGGGIGQWLDQETLDWGERCGTGCSFMGTLDVPSCQTTLYTGFGANYRWRPAGDYAAVDYAVRGWQAYLLDRGGNCWPLAGAPDPGKPCVGEPFQWDISAETSSHMPLDWSPDGRQLLVVSWAYAQWPAGFSCDLWSVAVPELTTTHLLSDTCYGNWSPDGQLISFLSLGRPVLNAEPQMVGAATDSAPGSPDAYLGVLDLTSRQELLSLPVPLQFGGSFYDPWDGYVTYWSPDSQFMLTVDLAGSLYLWRKGDARAIVVYYGTSLIPGYLPFSADSSAFFFQSGSRGWVARVR